MTKKIQMNKKKEIYIIHNPTPVLVVVAVVINFKKKKIRLKKSSKNSTDKLACNLTYFSLVLTYNHSIIMKTRK